VNAITELPTLRANLRDLSSVRLSNGQTRWAYLSRPNQRTGTAHRLSDCVAPGYFRDMASKIIEGDWIDITAHDGAATMVVVEVRNDPDWVRCVEMCSKRFG